MVPRRAAESTSPCSPAFSRALRKRRRVRGPQTAVGGPVRRCPALPFSGSCRGDLSPVGQRVAHDAGVPTARPSAPSSPSARTTASGSRSMTVSNTAPPGREPTIADAVLDRIVHNAYRIDLKGESQRKRNKPPPLDGGNDK